MKILNAFQLEDYHLNNLSVILFGQRHINLDIQIFIGWIGGPWP